MPNAARPRVRPNPCRKVNADTPYGTVGSPVTNFASTQAGLLGFETRERDLKNLERVQAERPMRPPCRRTEER